MSTGHYEWDESWLWDRRIQRGSRVGSRYGPRHTQVPGFAREVPCSVNDETIGFGWCTMSMITEKA